MAGHYDSIGRTYTITRAADPRITQKLQDLLALGTGTRLIDIGAGTGNYSHALAQAGFHVTAVEPSKTMRDQASPHDNLLWFDAKAESLPFSDAEFDGAIMTLCLHHFADWQQGIREALRVSAGGPLVVFAFDIEHKAAFWLFDYFPEFIDIDKNWAPTMDELARFVTEDLAASFERFPFPLPKDLVDHFASADWAHPQAYLQDEFRRGISSFAKLTEQQMTRGLQELQADLDSGSWLEKYGELLEHDEYDRGYLFLRIYKE
ncbi:MAG: class I SAM-dependent methyltransferase [Proteobacteria bacterium]|nr:class I SAM-dependent methyltransferase [Pseudomonadota bacterium]